MTSQFFTIIQLSLLDRMKRSNSLYTNLSNPKPILTQRKSHLCKVIFSDFLTASKSFCTTIGEWEAATTTDAHPFPRGLVDSKIWRGDLFKNNQNRKFTKNLIFWQKTKRTGVKVTLWASFSNPNKTSSKLLRFWMKWRSLMIFETKKPHLL